MRELISTERLTLRPLLPRDAEPLQRLAGEWAIADTMISVPHPFTLADAHHLIVPDRSPGETRVADQYFASCFRTNGELVGLTALRDVDQDHAQAELSFWVGQPYWGHGLASEAAAAVLAHAFEVLGLNRLTAYHMIRNPASGGVLRRLGFRQEGVLRQRVRKWGVFEDVAAYALLRVEYPATSLRNVRMQRIRASELNSDGRDSPLAGGGT